MSNLIKGFILLLAMHGQSWAGVKPVVPQMQAMSDDELEVVSDHGLATSAQHDEHENHDHHHGAQNDTLTSKQQEAVIYSIPQTRILPLK